MFLTTDSPAVLVGSWISAHHIQSMRISNLYHQPRMFPSLIDFRATRVPVSLLQTLSAAAMQSLGALPRWRSRLCQLPCNFQLPQYSWTSTHTLSSAILLRSPWDLRLCTVSLGGLGNCISHFGGEWSCAVSCQMSIFVCLCWCFFFPYSLFVHGECCVWTFYLLIVRSRNLVNKF